MEHSAKCSIVNLLRKRTVACLPQRVRIPRQVRDRALEMDIIAAPVAVEHGEVGVGVDAEANAATYRKMDAAEAEVMNPKREPPP
jgi:hypothetical protein